MNQNALANQDAMLMRIYAGVMFIIMKKIIVMVSALMTGGFVATLWFSPTSHVQYTMRMDSCGIMVRDVPAGTRCA